jgi:hypothetical protein
MSNEMSNALRCAVVEAAAWLVGNFFLNLSIGWIISTDLAEVGAFSMAPALHLLSAVMGVSLSAKSCFRSRCSEVSIVSASNQADRSAK